MIKTTPTRDRIFGYIEDTIGFATAPKSDRHINLPIQLKCLT
ncbi:MAG: hypothetical protein V7K48_01935 [Nostoc sp.]